MVSIYNIKMPVEKYSIKCPCEMTPLRITIHNTANCASARNEIAYMQSNDLQTSFHFAVDDIEAVQGSPLDRNTWHASDGWDGIGNRESISIEICHSYYYKIVNGVAVADEEFWQKNYKSKFEKAQENAAELVAYLLHEYGWGCDLSRVTKHQDYCTKYCPHRTMSDYGWDYFLDLVEKKYNEMYIEDEKMKERIEALEKEIEKLKKNTEHTDQKYNWTLACPDWAQSTVHKLLSKGYLKGDEDRQLRLSEDMVRLLVILDRAKVFD